MTITVNSPEELIEAADAAFDYITKISQSTDLWMSKTRRFTFGKAMVAMMPTSGSPNPCLCLANPDVLPATSQECQDMVENGEPYVILEFLNEGGLNALIHSLNKLRDEFKKEIK